MKQQRSVKLQFWQLSVTMLQITLLLSHVVSTLHGKVKALPACMQAIGQRLIQSIAHVRAQSNEQPRALLRPMRVMLQPLAGWLGPGLRTPGPALPALVRQLRLRRGLNSLSTHCRRTQPAQRQSRRTCISLRALHTEQSSKTQRVLELARQAAVQALPPESVVGT